MSDDTSVNAFSICDVVCDLDVQIERLNALGYWEEAAALHVVSKALTGSVELRLVDETPRPGGQR